MVKPGSVEELHEIRVSPAFTANTNLEFLLCRDSTLKADLNQFPHTLLTETSEGFRIPAGWEEPGGAISGQPGSSPGKLISSKGEESSGDGSVRNSNHRPNRGIWITHLESEFLPNSTASTCVAVTAG